MAARGLMHLRASSHVTSPPNSTNPRSRLIATARRAFDRTEAAIAAARKLPPRASIAREMRRIRRAEIVGSTTLAGSSLGPAEVDALLDRGRALGDHLFTEYELVRNYASAADWLAEKRALQPGDQSPIFEIDDLRELHARAVHGSKHGGRWRLGNPLPRANIVAPAAWLVARETAALVDRYTRGPREMPLPLWLATFLARFARLSPFENGNGRAARLMVNLLLRRLDAPPLVIERRDQARYRSSLAAAEVDRPMALATFIAASLVRTCDTLSLAASMQTPALAPLRELAGAQYSALAKAAQRGRLRTIVRGGRYLTTAAWIAEYRET